MDNKKDLKSKFSEMWKDRKSRFIIVIFAFLTLFAGIILMMRSFFIDSNGNISPITSFLNPNLQQNTPVKINTPQEFEDSTEIKDFASNLQTPFTMENSEDKIWLLLTTDVEKVIGYLDAEEKFQSVYKISKDSSLIKLLKDTSLVFATDPRRDGGELFIQSPDKNSVSLTKLEPGEFFTSIYFDPSEKLIYYSYIDLQGIFYLKSINLNGNSLEIYKSTFLNDKTRLAFTTDASIFLDHFPICQQLILKDKILSEIACENIKRNDTGIIYYSNELPSYISQTRGELYSFAFNETERKIILSGNEGQVFSKLTYQDEKLYFIKQNLKPLAASSFIGEDKSIASLNVKTLEEQALTDKLPTGLLKVVNTKKGLYALVGSVDNASLYKFFPQGYNKLVSAPSSTQTIYWDSYDFVNLPTENVELLSDGFIYDK